MGRTRADTFLIVDSDSEEDIKPNEDDLLMIDNGPIFEDEGFNYRSVQNYLNHEDDDSDEENILENLPSTRRKSNILPKVSEKQLAIARKISRKRQRERTMQLQRKRSQKRAKILFS